MYDSDKLNDRQVRGLLATLPLIGLFVLGVLLARGAFFKSRDEKLIAAADSAWAEVPVAAEPFKFDPNTVTYTELRRLGVDKNVAANLLHYRAVGKVFRIKEDLAPLYGMTDSLYLRLEPWIAIAPEYAFKPRTADPHGESREYSERRRPSEYRTEKRPLETPVPFRVDTVQAKYLVRIGFTVGRARAFVSIARDHGFSNAEDVALYPYFPDSLVSALKPYMIFPAPDSTATAAESRPRLVELNTADSATLLSVSGIGPKTVNRILRYRERLGGFFRAEQLSEVEGVTAENLARILPQVTCDTTLIRKIPINRASPDEFSDHPYMRRNTANRLLSRRQMLRERNLPAWESVRDLVEQKILRPEDAPYLRPYLSFE